MSTPATPARDTAGVIAPPPLIYLVGLGIGVLLEWLHPAPLLPPGLAPVLAAALALPSLVAIPAVRAFGRARTRPEPWKPTTALVTDGPYRFSRNPMYLGFSLLYLGLTALANSWWPLLAFPPVLVVMHRGVIVREEAYLERKFGAAYRGYRERVRRWL